MVLILGGRDYHDTVTGAHRGPSLGSLSSITPSKLPNTDSCPSIMWEMLIVAHMNLKPYSPP